MNNIPEVVFDDGKELNWRKVEIDEIDNDEKIDINISKILGIDIESLFKEE
jgi:hypothetical protein